MSLAHGAPDGQDEPVGAVLARMRRAKRLTGARLAVLVGMSQPKISRIERGKGQLDPEDVGLIARALGAGEETVRALMDRAERSHDRMTDWRPTMKSLSGRQDTVAGWESSATVIRVFEPVMIPGILQNDGYARLILEEFQAVTPLAAEDLTESALAAAVSARGARRVSLADRTKSFQFILGEATLRRRTYPLVDILAELRHLRGVIARNPNVSVKIIPEGAPTSIPPIHGFLVFDDDLVVVDLYNTGILSRSGKDVESYRRVFDMHAEHAVDIEPFLVKYEKLYIGMLQKPGTDPPVA